MKNYDIVARLQAKNQRPTIKITDDLEVKVNTSATAGLLMRALSEDGTDFDLEKIEKMLKITLGDTATQKVLELDLTIEALSLLLEAISSSFMGEDLPEEDAPFPETNEV